MIVDTERRSHLDIVVLCPSRLDKTTTRTTTVHAATSTSYVSQRAILPQLSCAIIRNTVVLNIGTGLLAQQTPSADEASVNPASRGK